MEDYSQKYKGEHVELALFGGEYQDGVLTAYCLLEDVPHVELNGHILVPLQNVASLHCTSRCDAPEGDWPPQRPARRRGVARSARQVAGVVVRAQPPDGRARVDRGDRARRPRGEQPARLGRHAEHVHDDRADHAAVRDADDRVRARRRARPRRLAHAARPRAAISGYDSPCSQPVPPASQRA